jgi:hypothetical protein
MWNDDPTLPRDGTDFMTRGLKLHGRFWLISFA